MNLYDSIKKELPEDRLHNCDCMSNHELPCDCSSKVYNQCKADYDKVLKGIHFDEIKITKALFEAQRKHVYYRGSMTKTQFLAKAITQSDIFVKGEE